MQDFRFTSNTRMVLLKPVPFFGLKTNQLKDVFAPSCMSCFDYVNSADLVVGLHGRAGSGLWCNDTGRKCWTWCKTSWKRSRWFQGSRHSAVQQSIPRLRQSRHSPHVGSSAHGCGDWKIGPKGLEYPLLNRLPLHHNYLYVKRHHPEKLDAHVPEFAKRLSVSIDCHNLKTLSANEEREAFPLAPLLPTAWGSCQFSRRHRENRMAHVLPLSPRVRLISLVLHQLYWLNFLEVLQLQYHLR